MCGCFAQSLNAGTAAFSSNGRYIRLMPQSDTSAVRKPLYSRYFGSERNGLFFADESTHRPAFPSAFASAMHAFSRSEE